MADATDVHFEVEDTITAGDRVVGLWRYSWADGHVRGADVMRVRDSRGSRRASPTSRAEPCSQLRLARSCERRRPWPTSGPGGDLVRSGRRARRAADLHVERPMCSLVVWGAVMNPLMVWCRRWHPVRQGRPGREGCIRSLDQPLLIREGRQALTRDAGDMSGAVRLAPVDQRRMRRN